MKDIKVTVQVSFAPKVAFTTQWFPNPNQKPADARSTRLKRVLEDWARITGLNWESMPARDTSDEPGNEEYECFIVTHPAANSGSVLFHWDRP